MLISIHAPRVGSDAAFVKLAKAADISIHAPRVGSDRWFAYTPGTCKEFQSTLPVWGATYLLAMRSGLTIISIHAPRVGSDCCTTHS